MSGPMNRRQAIAGAGAVAGALAIATPALASGGNDAELQALWREYLVAIGRWETATALCTKMQDRCMIEAREAGEYGSKEHERQNQMNRRKYGVAKLERTDRKLLKPVQQLEAQIIAAKAHGIEGVTIKLALSMYLDRDQIDENTYSNDRGAAASAYRALCDLTGTDHAAEAFSVEKRAWS